MLSIKKLDDCGWIVLLAVFFACTVMKFEAEKYYELDIEQVYRHVPTWLLFFILFFIMRFIYFVLVFL